MSDQSHIEQQENQEPILTAKERFDYDFQLFMKQKETQVKLLELRATLAEKSTDKYITIAAAALGGSIFYADKISTQTINLRAPALLHIGCIALVVAIGFFLFMRTLNNKDLGAALEGKFEESKAISENALSYGNMARIALVIGVLSITQFFLANFPVQPKPQGDCQYDKQQPTKYHPH